MKYVLIIFLLPLISYSQDVLRMNVPVSLTVQASHNQGLSMTHSHGGDAAPFIQSCTGTDCTFDFTSPGTFSLAVVSTDELGLSASNVTSYNVANYICEAATYTRRNGTNGYHQYEYLAFQNGHTNWTYLTNQSGAPFMNWNGVTVGAANPTNCTGGVTSCLGSDGWEYLRGSLAIDGSSNPYLPYWSYAVSRRRWIAPVCSAPSVSTNTICYPSNANITSLAGNVDLGVNSGASNCSNDLITLGGSRSAQMSMSTAGWTDANSTLGTSAFPAGTLIRAGSVNIGTNLGTTYH